MFETGLKKQKNKIAVSVDLKDGTTLLGSAFVAQQQRLSDVLNDERSFLPLETEDGVIVNLRKSMMTRVTELHQKADPRTSHDPYDILGVSPLVGDDELHDAYVRLARESHPDRFANLGLPAEVLEAAQMRMARINDAYHRALKARNLNR